MGIIKKLTCPGSPQTSLRVKTIPRDAKAGQNIHRSIFTTPDFRSSSIIALSLRKIQETASESDAAFHLANRNTEVVTDLDQFERSARVTAKPDITRRKGGSVQIADDPTAIAQIGITGDIHTN
jgi:hypothetical protein